MAVNLFSWTFWVGIYLICLGLGHLGVGHRALTIIQGIAAIIGGVLLVLGR